MNKFSQLIKESSEFEDIEDSLLYIYDTFGEPRVLKTNLDGVAGGQMAYVLRWDIGFSINDYNGTEVLETTAKLFTALSEVKSSQNRISGYDVDFKVSGSILFVRFIPQKSGESKGNYHFIIGQDWREVQLRYSEILRFFRDKGFKIIGIETEDDEVYQRSTVIISTNADGPTLMEFERIFGYNLKEEDVDRSVELGLNGGRIEVYSPEEKTYIVIDASI